MGNTMPCVQTSTVDSGKHQKKQKSIVANKKLILRQMDSSDRTSEESRDTTPDRISESLSTYGTVVRPVFLIN